ncbi:glycogen synthase (ADP-glucose) [Paramicrobacterium humi]|uniref:Glycogen synthase (ADP-glucose) n=1 Tax=Paramicrobacterium humi TaxID=640635 RepID=A0A1H4R2I8_9MICO|nr:glycogen synthase [Microbacterium humi]SEC26028.1 glycogen synthase (ADP-glucose) [Microbacterium humi]
MRVDLLTKEYPPAIYGGAGVHAAELVKALRESIPVTVRCFGEPRDEPDTVGYPVPSELDGSNGALQTLGTDLLIAQDVAADLVHSHTWYANGAGHLAKLLHGIPHVVTAHSLEPLRPWKAEQLGGGYRVSSWLERTAFEAADAVVAVSNGMRADILRSYPDLDPSLVHTIYNGIDLSAWSPNDDPDLVRSLGVDPDAPSIVFVGRITRQKGLPHLLRAARMLPGDVQLVLCAGAPDTPEIMSEVTGLVRELQQERSGVVWIDRMLERRELTALLTAATTFVCPSVYEPLGIVNLEAMACGAAVVGTGTGGIPEVVADGVTGAIVPIDQVDDGTGSPTDPDRFARDLAESLTAMVSDPDAAAAMGRAGRERAEREFSWARIARDTLDLYESVLS